MGTCVHFSRSLPSNSWWQTMAGWQVLSRPSAAEGGGRRPAFTGPATQPYSATEVDGWQHKLSRVSQNRAAVQSEDLRLRANTRSVPIQSRSRYWLGRFARRHLLQRLFTDGTIDGLDSVDFGHT